MSAVTDARISSDFSIAEARAILHDLFQHRPLIYWTDFLTTMVIGYSAAVAFLAQPLLPFSAFQLVCLAIAALGLHRLSNFMHEIVHFRDSQMRTFRIAWDLLAGVPMLTPSFFYLPHIYHHNTHYYGTAGDGEYLPLGRGPLSQIALFMSQVFLQPLLYIVRFTVLTPISFLHPRLRRWVLERVSTFGINWTYRRPIPDDAPRVAWAVMDILCWLRASSIFFAVAVAFVPPSHILKLYLLAISILSLTYVRTLVAHRFQNDGGKMSHMEQLFDSIDITGVPVLTELLFPLGLRYHALHHLFPSIPYHNLGIAHRRLLKQLPADSPYRQVVYPTFWVAFVDLIRSATGASADQKMALGGRQIAVVTTDADSSA